MDCCQNPKKVVINKRIGEHYLVKLLPLIDVPVDSAQEAFIAHTMDYFVRNNVTKFSSLLVSKDWVDANLRRFKDTPRDHCTGVSQATFYAAKRNVEGLFNQDIITECRYVVCTSCKTVACEDLVVGEETLHRIRAEFDKIVDSGEEKCKDRLIQQEKAEKILKEYRRVHGDILFNT